MQFLGLVQRKADDCHKSQDALHLLKELDSFQAELLPSQQRRLDEIKLLVRNHGMTFCDLTDGFVIANTGTLHSHVRIKYVKCALCDKFCAISVLLTTENSGDLEIRVVVGSRSLKVTPMNSSRHFLLVVNNN